jgi:O-acetyl-ADP-ribose deacetylase (regulator of RNase III)
VIRVVQADLESVDAEGILRAVDSSLEAVTPAGRALEARAGSRVIERLRGVGEVPPGGALVTPAGDLPASFLVHVVVRSREEPLSEALARKALVSGLRQASEWSMATLATAPLGTGPGGFDAETAAHLMVPLLHDHLRSAEYPREIVIVVANDYERDVFARLLERETAPPNPEKA